MSSLVVGLFERRSDAEAALNDLESSGFDRSHIEIKETYTEDSAHSLAHLRHELEGEGVPDSDAKLFEEGVRAGDTLEVAHVADDRAEEAREIMNRHGALDIHDAFAQRGSAFAAPIAAPIVAERTDGDVVVPVVEEQIAVGKREIQRGGVRIFQRVEERPVAEAVTLRDEAVSIERRTVADRPVSSAEAFAPAADVVVTETHEVPVVSKTARVVEEVVVDKTATERVETVTDTVRRTDVDVEDVTANTTQGTKL